MANYSESYLGFVFLVNLLSNDSTLQALAPGGVWNTLAPPSESTPFVFISHQSEKDEITANAFRIMTDHLFQVAAVGPASNTSGIAAAAAQVDKLLGGPPNLPIQGPIFVNSIQAGYTLSCYREQSLSIDWLVNTSLWNRTGGLYRLLIEQIAT